jgi:hypothetical protein
LDSNASFRFRMTNTEDQDLGFGRKEEKRPF